MKSILLYTIIQLVLPPCAICQDAYRVNTAAINVRADASPKASIVGILKAGDTVYGSKSFGKWLYIKHPTNSGYVSKVNLLKITVHKTDKDTLAAGYQAVSNEIADVSNTASSSNYIDVYKITIRYFLFLLILIVLILLVKHYLL